MFTDAMWSAMLAVVLLLALTVFFKAVFFRRIYDAEGLTTPQVGVDWRLWTVDLWFWLILGSLVFASLALNLVGRFCDGACDRRNRRRANEYKRKLEKERGTDSLAV